MTIGTPIIQEKDRTQTNIQNVKILNNLLHYATQSKPVAQLKPNPVLPSEKDAIIKLLQTKYQELEKKYEHLEREFDLWKNDLLLCDSLNKISERKRKIVIK